jgi:hypothetical protein
MQLYVQVIQAILPYPYGENMKTYKWNRTVMFAHCDVHGTIFYPYLYSWFDQSTEELFRNNQMSYADLKRDFGVVGMPLVETGARYLNACRLGDELEISTWVDEWGRIRAPGVGGARRVQPERHSRHRNSADRDRQVEGMTFVALVFSNVGIVGDCIAAFLQLA